MNTKHIYYTGDLYPCTVVCGYKEFSIGNVYEGTDRKKIQNLQKNIYFSAELC
jgi:radical SAM protein with 4Fe4S-binding SPASM domain